MNDRIRIVRGSAFAQVEKRTPELVLLGLAYTGGLFAPLLPLLRLLEPLTIGAITVAASLLLMKTGWTVRIEPSGITARWRVVGIPLPPRRFSFDVPITDELDWDGYDWVELREDGTAIELDAWRDAAIVARTLEEERDRLRPRGPVGPYRA